MGLPSPALVAKGPSRSALKYCSELEIFFAPLTSEVVKAALEFLRQSANQVVGDQAHLFQDLQLYFVLVTN